MCIRDRSFTWIPVDEWITGKQGHCTKDLSAGKYRLIEIKAADGFKLLAKPIEFTVTDGLEAVSYTHLDVYKRQVYACPFRPWMRAAIW